MNFRSPQKLQTRTCAGDAILGNGARSDVAWQPGTRFGARSPKPSQYTGCLQLPDSYSAHNDPPRLPSPGIDAKHWTFALTGHQQPWTCYHSWDKEGPHASRLATAWWIQLQPTNVFHELFRDDVIWDQLLLCGWNTVWFQCLNNDLMFALHRCLVEEGNLSSKRVQLFYACITS